MLKSTSQAIVHHPSFTVFLLFVLCFFSCQSEPTTLFTSLAPSKTGIDFKNTLRESEEFNVLNYGYFYNGGGVAVGDINNDGLPDIYFTGNMKASHLYLNKGDLQFEEIAEQAGVEAAGLWNTGVTMADVNNDGWLDIYVCRSAANLAVRRQNLLFINNRDSIPLEGGLRGVTFTEMATEFGLDDTGYSTQAAFFDYDRDGDLDMYLLNHSIQEYAGFSRFLKSYKSKSNPDYGDKLYENKLIPAEGESFGRFLDVTQKAGIVNNVLGFGLGIAVEDLNNDGWPDIYVSNDYNEEDYCYINQQDGTFKESIRDLFDHTSLFSMGSDVADINNDGLPEVYTLDMLPEDNFRQKMTSGADNFDKKQALYESGFHYQSMRNMLHLNNGDGSFSEIGQLAGISNTDWSWAALFADFDNDGWKDLFVTNGYKSDYTNMDFMSYAADQQMKIQQTGSELAVSDLLAKIPAIVLPNYIYKNEGDLTFSNQTTNWGLDQASLSNGAAYADLDNDGDLDLIVNNVNAVANIYRNNTDQLAPQHYLKVKLENCPLNTFGFGARLSLQMGEKHQYQTLMPSRGYQSSVEPILNFGLGRDSIIDRIIINWPDGRQQQMENVSADQLLTIFYDPETEGVIDRTSKGERLFSSLNSELAFHHEENPFNDFKREPLLPHMLSTQGPRLAVGDVNGDGHEDVYIGGASGFSGQLFLQNVAGNFMLKTQDAFLQDQSSEDLDALFFDADGDQDLDLYVSSGGNEYPEGAAEYQDRLYLNNGSGNFSKASNQQLPEMPVSTSCVTAGDWDADGDLDLFVGGRLRPGHYPLIPDSYLLENNGKGQFEDVTEKVSPALRSAGMVCDAQWTDFNNDQKLDLVLVGEWMPVRFFANEKDGLVEMPAKAEHSGWWNCITAADMDQDGDLDYVLGNLGRNAQIQVSEKEPMTIYAKDFDNNGSIDPIISYHLQGTAYPMAPKDDLFGQLVSLKKNFVFYEDYARASIEEVFPAETLQDAYIAKVNTLSTSYLENVGDGNFDLHPLPVEAQFAPTYGILCRDFNDDGHLDILLAGNLTETRVQFGRYDAGKGTLLLGDGTGNFAAAGNLATGLQIKGSVRDMQMLETADGRQLILVAKNNGPLQAIQVINGAPEGLN